MAHQRNMASRLEGRPRGAAILGVGRHRRREHPENIGRQDSGPASMWVEKPAHELGANRARTSSMIM
jgi:hypothetical protein